ncbi:MAG: hypothetical protein WA125_07695, partial [Desulfosporosinus sp.]
QEELGCMINPQEQAILDMLDQPQAVQNLLGICNGDLSVLLELFCQMELEGKVVVSNHQVNAVIHFAARSLVDKLMA